MVGTGHCSTYQDVKLRLITSRSVCIKELQRLLNTKNPDTFRLKHDECEDAGALVRQDKLLEGTMRREEEDNNTCEDTLSEAEDSMALSQEETNTCTGPVALDIQANVAGHSATLPSYSHSLPAWSTSFVAASQEESVDSNIGESHQSQDQAGDTSGYWLQSNATALATIGLPEPNLLVQSTNPPLVLDLRSDEPIITSLDLVNQCQRSQRGLEEEFHSLLSLRDNDEFEVDGFASRLETFLANSTFDINAPMDHSGRRPLCHVASIRDGQCAMSLLLKHGADPNAMELNGDTALHIAAGEANTQVCKLLIEHGADVNARNSRGFIALHRAAYAYDEYETTACLLEHGAEVDAKDFLGWTALHFAANGGYRSICSTLLEYKADVNAETLGGHTALHLAIESTGRDICRILLEHGADVNAKNADGRTAVQIAMSAGDHDLLQEILDFEPDLNSQKEEGLTALHMDVKNRDSWMCHKLSEHEAIASAQTLMEDQFFTLQQQQLEVGASVKSF